jgi:Putative peptidoglycan binding domain/LysM domain
MGDYTVRQGDCIESIAHAHGLAWEKLWDHAGNAALRERRKAHTALAPGDVVFVPERVVREVECATSQRHTFRAKGIPSQLRIRFLDHLGAPRAAAWVLELDGQRTSGTLDDGWLDHPMMPDVRAGTLELRWQEDGEERVETHVLELGHLDPLDTITGVQARLYNLGYYHGPIDGKEGEALELAVVEFQCDHDLDPLGLVDDTTRAALGRAHDEAEA